MNDIEDAASTIFKDTKFALEGDQEPLSQKVLQKQQKKGLIWVAVDEHDIPVGFVVILILDDQAHLHELSVDPDHGRRGIGTKLTKEVIHWANQTGKKRMTLSTFRDIAWNAPFYEKLGFREMKEEEMGSELKKIRIKESEMGLPIEERVLMVKEL
ncbi:MAG: GNAT family N-acetyltransferase [Acidobacteriota bacterium]|nr:MAG: GNAT family N-acetyltransferase [Acidobacteriota bacterium]